MSHLFDDGLFTKITMYHWAIKNCYDLSAFIETSTKFVRHLESNKLASLRELVHPFENDGVAKWSMQLNEDLEELQLVQSDVESLCIQVRELVRNLNPIACSTAEVLISF